jgi:tetratricopeptide (TPR) repeat protein
VKDVVATVEEKSTQVVEMMTEAIGDHVIPVFSRVGAAGAQAVETVKDKLSSDTDSDTDGGDGETGTVKDDPWSDVPTEGPSTTSSESDADTLVAEGEALSRDSKEAEALKKFNQAIALDPSHAMAWFNRGVIHEMRGEVDEACKAFRICLDMKGDHGPAAANLAVLLDRRGDSNSAASVAQKALSSFPGHPMLTKIAAGGDPAATVTQTPEEKAAPAEEIVEVSQPVVQAAQETATEIDLDSIVEEAAGLVKSGNPEDSLELLRELLHNEAAEHPRAWRIAAASMAQMELVDNAIEAFTYALDLDNEDAASWYNLGALHRKTGHEDSAVTCFDAALGLRPAYSKAASALAEIHTTNGDLGPAIDAWRSLLLVEPNHPGGIIFSEILVQIGEGEGEVLDAARDIPNTLPEGPALATEALNHIPQDGVSSNIQLRARALTLTSAFPEAVKLWRALIENDRDDVGLWTGMMRTFIAAGDQTTAEKCRQKIASLTGETVSVDAANDALAPVEPEPAPAELSEPQIESEPEQSTEADPEPAAEPAPDSEVESADDGLMITEEAPLSDDDPWGDAFEDSQSAPSEVSEPTSDPVYDPEEIAEAESVLDTVEEPEPVTTDEEPDPEVDLAKAALDAQAIGAAAIVQSPVRIDSTSIANQDVEWYNKGLSLIIDEKYTEALGCFDKALPSFLEDDVMVIRILNARGNALYYLKKYGDCIEAYHQAMKINPSGVTGATLYNMGTAYAEVERYEDGIKCFEQGMSPKRTDPLEGREAKMAKEQIRRCKILLKEQTKKFDRLSRIKS